MTNGRTILITGATSGIGRHAALHLARNGHRVIATGRNVALLKELTVEAEGTRLETVQLDVTDREMLARAFDEVNKLTAGRGVDVLVNNAGFGEVAPMADVAESDLRAMYETNVFGLFAVTRAFLPQMLERRSGRIINVGSAGGRVTLPLFGAYNSTKYAVESLSDAMRIELAPFGISVVIIEPGPIRTGFEARSIQKIDNYRDTSAYKALYDRTDEIRARLDGQMADVDVVTQALEIAILSSHPKARYVVPFTVGVGLLFASILPTPVLDWVLSRTFGLTRDGLGIE